eukprot:6173016-Pleurochrysis_carterae.AAC.2
MAIKAMFRCKSEAAALRDVGLMSTSTGTEREKNGRETNEGRRQDQVDKQDHTQSNVRRKGEYSKHDTAAKRR